MGSLQQVINFTYKYLLSYVNTEILIIKYTANKKKYAWCFQIHNVYALLDKVEK